MQQLGGITKVWEKKAIPDDDAMHLLYLNLLKMAKLERYKGN